MFTPLQKWLNRAVLLGVLVATAACQSASLFEEHQKLPNMSWEKAAPRTFKVSITQANTEADVAVALRHTAYIKLNEIRALLTVTPPSGPAQEYPVVLAIRDPQSGAFKGEVLGDLGDVDSVVLPSFRFDQMGTYTFQLAHTMPNDPVKLIMEIGLKVDQSKP
ncbi:MAG: gliding motility lipoprotein GldH [Bernardetiaceae bacterium]|jgi:gliding motility-associated lipoprotein GldH|nr:gliding motility lipoprotein GldH [Bernardetiaceae bacterium]